MVIEPELRERIFLGHEVDDPIANVITAQRTASWTRSWRLAASPSWAAGC